MFGFPDAGVLDGRIDGVLREARRNGVTLFGAGGFARATREALRALDVEVRAFVVSRPAGSVVDGTPVIALDAMNDALSRLPMWLAVFNRNADSELKGLAEACAARGVVRVCLPQEYFELIQHRMGWRYWLADRRQYQKHRDDFDGAFDALDDADSRRMYTEAVRFRVDPAAAAAPLPCREAQYFPPQVVQAVDARRSATVFVDGGAYDGDTIRQAARELGRMSLAYAFEPDAENFESLARNARSLDFPVVSIPCGLSDRAATLSFSDGQGEAGSIGADGGRLIQCVSLDQCLGSQAVDYLKLDVEGHELAVLEGAQRLLEQSTPVVAVAAYHRWDDLWRIPRFFTRHARSYKLMYRAHESNTFDGVFYAIPR